MGALEAIFKGLKRGSSSPGLLLAVWVANVLVALPGAVLVGLAIGSSVGGSLAAENLRQGFDLAWFGEFSQRASGMAATLSPSQVGVGAFLDNLDAWFGGRIFTDRPALVAAGVIYALLWILLLGGILSSFAAAPQRFSTGRFFAACGRFVFRFVRLTLLAAPLYGLIYLFARRLFPWIERMTRDLTEERLVLAAYLGGAAVVVLLVFTVRIGLDYAKIALVVEHRRSALLAALRGLGFALRRPLRTYGIFFAFVLLGAGLLALYAALAPGAGQTTWTGVVAAFLGGQLLLVGRAILRLALLAAETEFYRARRGGPHFGEMRR